MVEYMLDKVEDSRSPLEGLQNLSPNDGPVITVPHNQVAHNSILKGLYHGSGFCSPRLPRSW